LSPVEVMDIRPFRLLRGVSVAPSAMSLSLTQFITHSVYHSLSGILPGVRV